MLDYMKKGEWIPQPNFRYGQGARQDQQGHRHKFKAMDKILENIDGKVTEVGSSNLQVLNMMKMLETQVAQL